LTTLCIGLLCCIDSERSKDFEILWKEETTSKNKFK